MKPESTAPIDKFYLVWADFRDQPRQPADDDEILVRTSDGEFVLSFGKFRDAAAANEAPPTDAVQPVVDE